MRKWVWVVLAFYIMVLAFLAFGDHSIYVNNFLARYGLKTSLWLPNPLAGKQWPYSQFAYEPPYIAEYAPGYGAFLAYALGGALLAYIFQRKRHNETKTSQPSQEPSSDKKPSG